MIKFEDVKEEAPEVQELKKKVEQVAREYARRHRWCEVVDQALNEMGIKDTPNKIEVTFTVPVTAAINLDLEPLRGKSDEEQAEFLAKALAKDIRVSAGHQQTTVIKQAADFQLAMDKIQVTDAKVWKPQPLAQPRGVRVPQGFVGRFAGYENEGKVVHLIRRGDFDYVIQRNGGGYTTAVCGQGVSTQQAQSTKSEQRICASCRRSVPE